MPPDRLKCWSLRQREITNANQMRPAIRRYCRSGCCRKFESRLVALQPRADRMRCGAQLTSVERAFPHGRNLPAKTSQLFIHTHIAKDSHLEHFISEIDVERWRRRKPALCMAMPETSVDEHNRLAA